MGDRGLVHSPPPTMRGGILEPLDHDNMPLQAVIVKNGKIFIDSIDPPVSSSSPSSSSEDKESDNEARGEDRTVEEEEDVNDENKRLEEEIDRLTGGVGDDDDDDDYYIGNSKFSQEAFDSFMRATDNEEDDNIGDIMIYNQLHGKKEKSEPSSRTRDDNDDEDEDEGGRRYQYHIEQHPLPPHYQQQRLHQAGGSNSSPSFPGSPRRSPVPYGFYPPGMGPYNGPEPPDVRVGPHPSDESPPRAGGCRRRDSLNMEEYSTFSEDVDRLLSEDVDASWRYVPLYPEHYYGSGQEVQRVSVITDLPALLRDNNAECMKRVVPKVREVLHVANMEMQLAAASAFLQILDKKLVSVEDYRRTFLQTILTSVDNKNEEIAGAWLDTLLSCIDKLPKDVVKKDILHGQDYILSIAVNKGQLSQTLQARISCCKILGKVSSVFENFVVKNDVLPVVSSLCGDVEYDVRACMCERLDVVAKGLGLDLTKSKLLPQLIELSEDESQSVICACLQTTTNIIPMLDREANVNAILPMVRELCEKAINNVDSTLPVVSKLFGKLSHSLLEYMTVDDKTYFQEFFKKLTKVGVSEKKNKEDTAKLLEALDVFESVPDNSTWTRQYAAYNFPAMVLFIGAKLFRLELYPSFTQLCKDPHIMVRKTMAGGFHEVARLVGANISIVFPELTSLLSDADLEVLKAIVPNFRTIMGVLANQGVDQFTEHKAHVVQDVVSSFLRAESIVFNSPCWRTQQAMLESMQCLWQLCNNDYVYTKVLPLVAEKLKTGRALPVRIAAAKTIVILTRHLRYKEQREDILAMLKEDFHGNESCHRRSLFVEIARCYLEVNSKQAFKDALYEHVLSLRTDRVATVRMKLISLLPELKRSLKLPRDQSLRTSLDTVVRQIIVYDKDRDVQYAAQQMSEELTLIQEGSDSTRTNRRNLTEEETEDLKREDEEKEMIAREEKEKKDEEAKQLKGNEKRHSLVGNKKETQSKIPGAKKGTIKTSQAGSKGDGPHQVPGKRVPASTVGGSVSTKEPRPSTPPKKEPARRIPVLVANKTASSPSLTGNLSNKKSISPTPTRKGSTNIPASSGAANTLANSRGRWSLHRRGSASNAVSSTQARRGSIGSANSTSSGLYFSRHVGEGKVLLYTHTIREYYSGCREVLEKTCQVEATTSRSKHTPNSWHECFCLIRFCP
ncbi:serine/threonine-protein phosphatase 4 regulatory subunit 4 isoform X2 [Aplysia californica]|uniref:Serine/threonine-protein phosphatase 4 regulatory subunit 4 isoform X2 n=1 Tax=Aplysia californica TaxID=6500 RepID=A0ABM1A8J4_APLCA|nr:serine/threonine-protein phosphatase 4 regulatory subunit 4 isoform X2 [Aplysia californica]